MWPLSEATRGWHDAISALWLHTAFCDACQTAEKWDHARRCVEGQKLYHAEQTAYGQHISAEYAGRAA